MIKFTVTHSCGHEVTHGFSGAPADRARREEWLRQRPCQVCWQVEQSKTAANQRQEWNLPPLEGSEGDVAWAEVIRMKAMAHNKEFQKKLLDGQDRIQEDDATKQTILDSVDAAMRELERNRDAAWWVANRFEALSYVKRRIAEAVAPILKAREEQ